MNKFILGGGVLAVLLIAKNSSGAKGIKNNNPLNIEARPENNWIGKVSNNRGRFEVFTTPIYGIRAAAKLIVNYQDKYGIDTIAKLITRWAPPSDNNPTQEYINYVSRKTNIPPNQPITMANHLDQIIPAMIYMENGSQPYTQALIDKGIRIA